MNLYQYFDITAGNDETLPIVVADPDTGEPIDLDGADLWFYAKRELGDEDDDALITKTTGAGIAIGSPTTDGEALVTLDSGDTASIDIGGAGKLTARWELQGKLSGKIRTLATGYVTIRARLISATAT